MVVEFGCVCGTDHDAAPSAMCPECFGQDCDCAAVKVDVVRCTVCRAPLHESLERIEALVYADGVWTSRAEVRAAAARVIRYAHIDARDLVCNGASYYAADAPGEMVYPAFADAVASAIYLSVPR